VKTTKGGREGILGASTKKSFLNIEINAIIKFDIKIKY